jgi:hypothetical protein
LKFEYFINLFTIFKKIDFINKDKLLLQIKYYQSKMKLRSGKYTSKDDLLNNLEEQEIIQKENVKRIEIDDLLFYNSPELKIEFMIGVLFILYVITMYLMIIKN